MPACCQDSRPAISPCADAVAPVVRQPSEAARSTAARTISATGWWAAPDAGRGDDLPVPEIGREEERRGPRRCRPTRSDPRARRRRRSWSRRPARPRSGSTPSPPGRPRGRRPLRAEPRRGRAAPRSRSGGSTCRCSARRRSRRSRPAGSSCPSATGTRGRGPRSIRRQARADASAARCGGASSLDRGRPEPARGASDVGRCEGPAAVGADERLGGRRRRRGALRCLRRAATPPRHAEHPEDERDREQHLVPPALMCEQAPSARRGSGGRSP